MLFRSIVHNNRVYIYEIQEDIDNAETWNFYIKLRAREVDPASVNRCVATDIDNIPVYEKDNVECYTVTCEDEDNVMVHLVDTKIVGIDGANILISEYSHFKKIEGK